MFHICILYILCFRMKTKTNNGLAHCPHSDDANVDYVRVNVYVNVSLGWHVCTGCVCLFVF